MNATQSLILSASLLIAAQAFAQTTTPTPTTPAARATPGAGAGGIGGATGGAGPEQRPNRPPGPRGGMADLSPELRTLVQTELRAMMQATTDLRSKLTQANAALAQAMFAESIDESAIRARAADVGKIEGDIALVRARHYANLKGKIPAESLPYVQRQFAPAGAMIGMPPGGPQADGGQIRRPAPRAGAAPGQPQGPGAPGQRPVAPPAGGGAGQPRGDRPPQ